METITINGPAKLKGTVRIQGAKNSAMRLVVFPLLTSGKFQFENIPDITSTRNLALISELMGAKFKWNSEGRVDIDSSSVKEAKFIPEDLFYHTSGGIYFIPLLASRFGECEIEKSKTRSDTGGDAIGSRTMEPVIETLRKCGIGCVEEENLYKFRLVSKKPFQVDAKDSFAASTNSLIAALFKEGESTIVNCSQNPEFQDNLEFLTLSGAKIKKSGTTLEVQGPAKIKAINFRCMSDKNDFVTWLFAAIATKSEITVSNVNISEIHVEPLFGVLDKWGVKLHQKNENEVQVDLSKLKLIPVDLVCGNYPMFHSDWQPLIAPILTQIEGESTIVDTLFTNRLRYFEQLSKMGARFEFFTSSKAPEKDGNPRAVKIFGGNLLGGANLTATDVRAGACFAIAALIANGETEITGVEHIERGYESFDQRLQRLISYQRN